MLGSTAVTRKVTNIASGINRKYRITMNFKYIDENPAGVLN